MPHKGKSNLYKASNFLRNGLRILFLVIFLHWILWITSYANCVNYQEAISEKNIPGEEKQLKKHDDKTKHYQRFTGWFNEKKEMDIKEIEDDVLKQIEEKKKKELGGRKLPRKWKEHFEELDQLFKEKKKLEEKENKSSAEEVELKKKQEEYNKKFEKAKEETIKNIEDQLRENKLNITELDDKKSLSQRILYDPLKFFVVSPLNKTSKLLGMHIVLEIIFKLLVIEIIAVLIYYSETIVMWENLEKIRDPSLSIEEKEQLNLEAASLFKYSIFNLFMMMLFNFILSLHPAFFDRTHSLFQPGTPRTEWWIWVLPIFFSLLLSSISMEFLHQGRLLTKQELKTCVAKNWVFSLFIALISLAFIRLAGMSSIGNHLFFFFGGLVRFIINTIRVKAFGHREYSPQGSSGRRGTGGGGRTLRRPYA